METLSTHIDSSASSFVRVNGWARYNGFDLECLLVSRTTVFAW